jgi:tryptophan synthase beta chain
MAEVDVYQIALAPDEMPHRWYNIIPDLPEALPPPQGDEQLKRLPTLMIARCLEQEMSQDRWIDIPEGVRDLYLRAGRPRPLFRARAYAAAMVGLKCTIYWVRAVYRWKKSRRNLMNLMGAEVFASPSPHTDVGRQLYEKNNDHPGSLSIAISEGLEDAGRDTKATYALGSVLNHVLMHQSIIGLETQKQFEKIGDYPDLMISCLGGGSNFGGFVLPFVGEVLTKGKKIQFIAAQSKAAPNLQGEYRYDYADHGEITPQLKMYTLGHQTEFPPIKGDGLRYHGCSPIISLLRKTGHIDTVAYPQDEKYVFEKAELFVRTEGFLPAPESAYSIACAIDEAVKCKETGEEKVIAFNVSGHGFMDMVGYDEVLGLSERSPLKQEQTAEG